MNNNVKQTIENLEKNNIAGFFVKDKEALFLLLQKLILPKHVVGCGDSMTLQELGVYDFLRQYDCNFLDKYSAGISSTQKRSIYIKNFSADTFVTGVNAITKNGEIFNIDGNGSRVAPILYGPDQVIMVAGTNKITDNIETAIFRTRQTAAPLDAKRLKKQTPCTKLGRCVNCRHPERICNDFVMIAGQFKKHRIKVIFIDGIYGY